MDFADKGNAKKDILGIVGSGPPNQKAAEEERHVDTYTPWDPDSVLKNGKIDEECLWCCHVICVKTVVKTKPVTRIM